MALGMTTIFAMLFTVNLATTASCECEPGRYLACFVSAQDPPEVCCKIEEPNRVPCAMTSARQWVCEDEMSQAEKCADCGKRVKCWGYDKRPPSVHLDDPDTDEYTYQCQCNLHEECKSVRVTATYLQGTYECWVESFKCQSVW